MDNENIIIENNIQGKLYNKQDLHDIQEENESELHKYLDKLNVKIDKNSRPSSAHNEFNKRVRDRRNDNQTIEYDVNDKDLGESRISFKSIFKEDNFIEYEKLLLDHEIQDLGFNVFESVMIDIFDEFVRKD